MRKLSICFITAAFCCLPLIASAHTGGALDADGCHADHRTGTYHCHRGPAGGYTFPNRAAMLEAVRTGKYPEKTVEKEGFFSRLWPFGKHHETAPAEPESAGGAASTTAGAAAGSGAAVAPGGSSEAEQRLKVLQGLYEMGLISKDEYEAKRKAVLDQL